MAGPASLRRFHLEGVRDTDRVIGDGAYAVVKELEFRGLKCAGKKLHAVLYESASREWRADMLRRFARECELLGQLHHPHIVQFLGVRVEAGSELPELVMEYLPTTLRRCLDTHGALPAEIGGTILLEVALGLRYLHEFSPPIIHRDLSSNNVLLTTSMTAKISDLGVAKILDVSPGRAARMTQTQAPGTPTFMPPEAMFSRPKYTSKVDIFSFGVLVVHVLSGEWPMPGGAFAEDPHDPNGVVLVTEFERRREYINRISEGHTLLGLIEQCLSNVASRRPDAAEVVLQLLAERDRVPPRPENRLELLQQVQSLRAELQQCSREAVEALRREVETLIGTIETERAEKDAEVVTLRREIEIVRADKDTELQAVMAERSLLEREQSSHESQRAGLQREVESLRAELALREERSRAETESLPAQVQQLTVQPRATPPEASTFSRYGDSHPHTLTPSLPHSVVQSPPGLSPHTRLQWRRGIDAPEGLIDAQAVVMGESVYVGGGGTGYKIFQYSWRRGVWNTLPECPVKHFCLIQFMGRLTTVGGQETQDRAVSRTGHVYEFVSESQRWQESLPPMPTARSSVTVIARPSSSSKPPAIAVCGGWGDGWVKLNIVEVFCQSTSQWHTAEPLPTPLLGLTSATVGDIAYLLGGVDKDFYFFFTKKNFSVSLDSLFDTATPPGVSQSQHGSLWMAVSDTPLVDSSAASLGGSLVAIGGQVSSTDSPSAAIHLLTSSGSWERVRGGDLPEPRSRSAAVFLPSGELMVVGGNSKGPFTASCTLFVASIAN